MLTTIAILLLWLGFAGSHMALSSTSIRPRLVERLGASAFLGVYSLVAFGFFVPLVWTYFAHKHAGPWLWMLPRTALLRWTMYLGMAIAFVLLVASLMRPSPTSFMPGDPTPRGVYRIARHPLFMALAIFGLLHLLPNGSTADIAFFGGFAVFAFMGAWHQDQRKLAAATPGLRQFYAATPFVPFTGSATLQGVRELSPIVIAAAVLLTIVVRYFHPSWFGGS